MKMKLFFCTALMLTTLSAALIAQGLGQFTGHADVGNTKIAGTAIYNPDKQSFTVTGSGANVWSQDDEFQFVYRKMKGDFILRTNVKFEGEGVEEHRKTGWMIRHSLEGNSPSVLAAVHGDGTIALQYRPTPGIDMAEKVLPVQGADVIQLERRGNTFIMSAAKMGERFFEEQVSCIDLGEEVYVGLFVCSHNADVAEKVSFRNVRIVVPPKPDFTAYRDYLGSHIEVMDVATGDRRIVYSAPNSLQAPNWMIDPNIFTYSADGLLYDFDLRTGKPVKLNTDFAVNNNNDHVISFDGRRMGISNTPKGENRSIIYIIPREGGVPVRVTPNGPSYFHGWSPDGKYMVFAAVRNNEWDVFRISSKGGQEINLTNTPGLNDGPEYTPDGKYIYFNSNRTGTTQIYRMDPDGRNPVQVTFDELNDWFPHISPDGKWIVFISFPRSVPSGDHPFYKHVYIRLMPITGGEPKIIAYVFGGQGTMNVPNWSPDGKQVVFVSNSGFLNY